MRLNQKYNIDFPTLDRKIGNNNIIYFDSAATSLVPKRVADAVYNFDTNKKANVHRSSHLLGNESTEVMESTRESVKNFINANSTDEVIFTSGTTMSINTLANSIISSDLISDKDEILLTSIEHHANLVPWQQVTKNKNVNLKFYQPKNGIILIEEFIELVNDKTKLVTITGQSNVTGQEIDLKNLIKKIKEKNPSTLIHIDAAQLITHKKLNVQELNVDFISFSAHKMLGPTGIGVLWGRKQLFENMPPFITGGEMIDKVTLDETTFNILPFKFEAGTPNISSFIGFTEAINIIEEIGQENISQHMKKLTDYALEKMNVIEGLEIYGPKDGSHNSLISFNVEKIHPHDIAHMLNDLGGIGIRSGHHCAQPLMKQLGIKSSCRVSFSIYNDKSEIDKFIETLKKIKGWLS
ncbi:MAG: SufS family cysteine desulfurase [Thermotogota bacterium]